MVSVNWQEIGHYSCVIQLHNARISASQQDNESINCEETVEHPAILDALDP